ncbi:hypothetical protein PAMA_020764 [Pampus argenteus]
MDVYMDQVKESAKRALEHLDDTEYRQLKSHLSHRLDEMHFRVKALQAQVSPYTDSAFKTIVDATAGFRAAVEADIEALKADIEPKRIALRDVLERHLEQYKAQLEPIIREQSARHHAEMESLRSKLSPIVDDLRAKVAVNIEETKAAIMPIAEAVRAKVSERLEELKDLARPYVEEYKDQMKQAYDQAKQIKVDDLVALRQRVQPLVDDIGQKLHKIAEMAVATVH